MTPAANGASPSIAAMLPCPRFHPFRLALEGSSMLYIGIDSGTQSTKSIVLDLASGQIMASAQKTYELIPGLPPGHLEQDPQVWLEAVDATIQACLQQLGPRKNELRAVGVSGQQHGLVA